MTDILREYVLEQVNWLIEFHKENSRYNVDGPVSFTLYHI